MSADSAASKLLRALSLVQESSTNRQQTQDHRDATSTYFICALAALTGLDKDILREAEPNEVSAMLRGLADVLSGDEGSDWVRVMAKFRPREEYDDEFVMSGGLGSPENEENQQSNYIGDVQGEEEGFVRNRVLGLDQGGGAAARLPDVDDGAADPEISWPPILQETMDKLAALSLGAEEPNGGNNCEAAAALPSPLDFPGDNLLPPIFQVPGSFSDLRLQEHGHAPLSSLYPDLMQPPQLSIPGQDGSATSAAAAEPADVLLDPYADLSHHDHLSIGRTEPSEEAALPNPYLGQYPSSIRSALKVREPGAGGTASSDTARKSLRFDL
ncbi:hypothetical protein Tdes44962_MAKER07222 [Teratosphaeria destructans]|uniref:Uncharacterized protein n=1 Tax=Teratosphaeria destructans TaxID=418781 RepID=A0A9W7SZQ4_9PEZI|nr:hypothetical protein Tdes44962_MAKER07222 [Teratosphaeria destructans]